MDITGTTALVTGAASGLGAATARVLAERGATVLGLDLAASVEAAAITPGVRYVAADVTSRHDVADALAVIGRTDPPLRIVVNCAGIAPSSRILSSRGTSPSWRW